MKLFIFLSITIASIINANAQRINFTATQAITLSQTINTTYSSNTPACFKFVATNTNTTVLVQSASNFDAVVEIAQQKGNRLHALQTQDNTYSNDLEELNLTNLIVGNEYFVVVNNYNTANAGQFSITVNETLITQAPINDEPSGAIELQTTMALTKTIATYTPFTTVGASNSTALTVPSNCADANGIANDVWFKVKVPVSGAISIRPQYSVTQQDASIGLYSGTPSSLTLINAVDDNSYGLIPTLYQANLTPNSYVYVRYWSNAQARGNGGIKVMAGANDGSTCADALEVCDFNGVTGTTSAASPPTRPCNMAGNSETAGGPFGACPGGGNFGTGCGGSPNLDVTIDHNLWVKFTASQTSITLSVTTSNCSKPANPAGVQTQIFSSSGTCCGFAPVSSFDEALGTYSITATGLTPGQSYYLMIDPWGTNYCDFVVTGSSGVSFGEAIPDKTSICVGESATITAPSGASGYTWTAVPGPNPSGTGNAITVSPTVTTDYTVDMTGYCNNKQSTVTITVGSLTPTISPAATTACKGGIATYTVAAVAGSTYTWVLAGGIGGSTTNSITVTWGSGATGSLKITQTSGTCSGTDQINVTLVAPPTAGFSYPNSPVCDDVLLLPYALAPGATAGDFTSSSTLFGGNLFNGNVVPASPLTLPGTYTMTNTVTLPGCPTVTATANYTIKATPRPVISPNSAVACKGTGLTSTYTVTAVPGDTYLWTVTGGTATGLNTNTIIVTWTGATGSVSVAQTRDGCTGNDNISNIVLTQLPVSNFTYTTPVCQGNVISPILAPGSTAGTFTSTVGLNIVANGDITTKTSTPGTYTITNTIAAAGGCPVVTSTAPLVLNPAPIITLTTTNAVVCATSNGTYHATVDVGTLVWTVTGGTLNSGQGTDSIKTTWGSIPPGKVVVVATNSFGCKTRDSVNVTINPLPTALLPSITPNDTICADNVIIISAPAQAGVTSSVYTTPVGGTAIGTVNFTSPVLFLPTKYYVETVMNATGCKANSVRDSILIHVNPLPLAPIISHSPNDSICFGNKDTIKVTPVAGVVTNVYSTLTGGISLGTTNYVTAPINVTTTYYLETKIITTGCTSSKVRDSVKITMMPRPARPTLTVAPNDTICLHDSVTFKANVTGLYTTIKWYITPKDTLSIGRDSIKVSPTFNQYYYVEVRNDFGCKADEKRDSVKVTVLPLPDLPKLTKALIEICEGDSIVLKATVNPTTATIFWLSGTAWTDTIKRGPDFTSPNLTATTTYYMGSISKDGCKNDGAFAILPVIVNPLPHVEVTSSLPDNTVYEGQTITFDAQPGTYKFYNWYVETTPTYGGDHLFNTQELINGQTIKVLVTTDKGCKNWGDNTIKVKVLPISNAFTPNGDGKNDLFLKGIDIQIFNRWGQLLYTGNEGWDGKYKGNTVSPGTYYYMLKIKKINSEEIVEKSGSVTVVLD